MDSLTRQSIAEEHIENLQSLVERIQLYVQAENGFSTGKQLKYIEKCNALLKKALLQPRSPNAGEYIPNIRKGTVQWAAQAWIDGRTQHQALELKTIAQRHDIEDRALQLLKDQIPKYSWQHHQRELAARVLKRFERRLVHATLSPLTTNVRDALISFKPFKRGDKYKNRKYHEFGWGEKVLTEKNSKMQQPYGFVCHETDMFVFMIDKNGNQFHKKNKCAINNNPEATH